MHRQRCHLNSQAMTKAQNRFYVYAYLRADGSPYYIGKGTGKRIHGRHTVKMPVKERRVMLFTGLADSEAISREIALVKLFGRKDQGTGILRNLTDGGDGTAGRVHSGETKAKIALANTGKTQSPLSVKKRATALKGKKRTFETRNKMSKAMTGRKASNETKNKMSASHQGRVKSASHLAALSESRIRNTAAKHGVEFSTWKLLTGTQRRNAPGRAKSLGLTVSEYIARNNWASATA